MDQCMPLDPKTMKNEGFEPPIYGLLPLKMKVVGSHGVHIRRVFFTLDTKSIRPKQTQTCMARMTWHFKPNPGNIQV